MMHRPKQVKILIFLWILVCISFIILSLNYFNESLSLQNLVYQRNDAALYFFMSIIFLIVSIITIIGIYKNKKWSWLASVVLSFGFLFYYYLLASLYFNLYRGSFR